MSSEISIPKSLLDQFEKIWIDEKSLQSPVAERVLKFFNKDKIEIVEREPWSEKKGTLSPKDFDQSKKNLYLTPFAGQFFKRCPGATQKKTLTCCNYHVLNLGSQCNMNCSYCYLQSYLNTPVMKIYTNMDQALSELRSMAELHPNSPFRVGTGEVIDSLSLDPLTLYSRELIGFFKEFPAWTLEFKSKSNFVEQFLDLGPAKNVIVSWSLNADFITRIEEFGTASLDQRLQAAERCRDAGFSLAFHLDPLIWHPQWKENYSDLVDRITQKFSWSDIHVISLGALRFQPEQKHMMRERFGPKSWVLRAEMFPSEGRKLRYDFSLRNEMFQFVLKKFREADPRWNIFLCMETPETWLQSFESTPRQVQGLREIFRPLPKLEVKDGDFSEHLSSEA